jgi:hypothetical protein
VFARRRRLRQTELALCALLGAVKLWPAVPVFRTVFAPLEVRDAAPSRHTVWHA